MRRFLRWQLFLFSLLLVIFYAASHGRAQRPPRFIHCFALSITFPPKTFGIEPLPNDLRASPKLRGAGKNTDDSCVERQHYIESDFAL